MQFWNISSETTHDPLTPELCSGEPHFGGELHSRSRNLSNESIRHDVCAVFQNDATVGRRGIKLIPVSTYPAMYDQQNHFAPATASVPMVVELKDRQTQQVKQRNNGKKRNEYLR
ncbi:hypothetical protein T12_15005 [Trichinella patagoniensis]|uniref:Uncharacterized protein n=1 Tax=Trichinella patagoniensis TaxID=990121 RepID=A0A0V0ZM30_9BILA|nr:hypothetical protein T12_15005 [Trichinella patagoniensis]